jgi:thiosulfate dehydrogenase (quinone) large subunit
MDNIAARRALTLFFRLAMAWTFLYAASHQVFDPGWSVAGFLKGTKTFHDVYAPLATETWAPVLTFLVGYGHLLIGLSLLFGLFVRASASFGIGVLLLYWTAHMSFPFIENRNNFLLDYHIVYAGVLLLLIVERAGHVWGLDAWAENIEFFDRHPKVKAALVA